jgi:glycosyltransferase
MSPDSPSISIITAAKNASATMGRCMSSVRGQVYPAQHIIVEGSPTNKTAIELKNDPSNTATIIYEPDLGIYDAINRGLCEATGDIIGTLNADDFYAHDKVLSRVAKAFENRSVDSCYGDLIYVDARDTSKITRYWKATPYRKELLFRGWMPPHPTFFVRRSIYEQYGGFNPNLGSSADYELIIRFFMVHHISTEYIPEVLVLMQSGGLSNASLINRIKANRMDKMAWKVNRLKARPWTFIAKPFLKIGQYCFKKAIV